MRKAMTRNWSVGDLTAPAVSEVAPFASLSLLLTAEALPVAVATMPYAGTAHSFIGNTTDSGYMGGDRISRWWAQVIAPGAAHGRMAVSVCRAELSGVGNGLTIEAWTDTGGKTGANVVLLNDPGTFGFNVGAQRWDANFACDILLTDPGINDTPAASTGRQFELAPQLTPYVEDCFIQFAAGVSLLVTDRPDLETL